MAKAVPRLALKTKRSLRNVWHFVVHTCLPLFLSAGAACGAISSWDGLVPIAKSSFALVVVLAAGLVRAWTGVFDQSLARTSRRCLPPRLELIGKRLFWALCILCCWVEVSDAWHDIRSLRAAMPWILSGWLASVAVALYVGSRLDGYGVLLPSGITAWPKPAMHRAKKLAALMFLIGSLACTSFGGPPSVSVPRHIPTVATAPEASPPSAPFAELRPPTRTQTTVEIVRPALPSEFSIAASDVQRKELIDLLRPALPELSDGRLLPWRGNTDSKTLRIRRTQMGPLDLLVNYNSDETKAFADWLARTLRDLGLAVRVQRVPDGRFDQVDLLVHPDLRVP